MRAASACTRGPVVGNSSGEPARFFAQCLRSWERTDGVVFRRSDARAAWGQELVLHLSWLHCYETFAMRVRRPGFINRWDLRFVGHSSSAMRTEIQNQARASGRTAGYFCDCRGCGAGHDNSHRLQWEDLKEEDAPTYLERCCQSLPTSRLPRDSKDGHFAIVYENLRRDRLHAAWQLGAIDATWLCWACLGRTINTSFEQMVNIHVGHTFKEAYIARRTRERARHEPLPKARRIDNVDRYSTPSWLQRRATSLWVNILEQLTMHRQGRLDAYLAAEPSALDAP